ncbi:non-ribosomal peptide synthetase, partial [Serratia rubidaea]|uniref:non-ribosomal peptide synthetase n=1 Tax=Serratia rubidaea TaxID=61652 RepID=UPI00177C2073
AAYYTGEALEAGQLRREAEARLPEYMVPAAYVHLAALPLTANGKLDRRALPLPEGDAYARQAWAEPQGDTEQTLAQLWQALLPGVERVGRHDNFFELGGHSLLVITLIERMRRQGLYADIRTLFTAPTLAELAARVSDSDESVVVPPNLLAAGTTAITPEMLTLLQLSQRSIDAIVAQSAGGVANIQDIYPLTSLQEGLLFHHLSEQQGDAYLLLTLLGFNSRAGLMRFLGVLQQVIDRHDILRTSILWEGLEQPVQVVHRTVTLPVEFITLDAAQGDAQRQLEARFDPGCSRLDIRQPPLLRCYAAQDCATERWLLAIQAHHLIDDNTSLKLLLAEAQMLDRGEGALLPEPVPFRNVVAQSQQALGGRQHEAFFNALLGDIDTPTIPFGVTAVAEGGRELEEQCIRLESGLALEIRRHARALGISPASVMHLAWALVVARATGLRDVVFGTVLFGRMHAGGQTDLVMGMSINTLPVRVNVGEECSLTQALQAMHRLLIELLQHEHAPLAQVQRCSGVAAPLPLFTSLLNYRHSGAAEGSQADGFGDGIDYLGGYERSSYPLTLSVDDLGGEFELTAQADRQITPQRICAFMHRALEQLILALNGAPESRCSDIDVMPAAEYRQLAQFNPPLTPPDAAEAQGIHQRVERWAQTTPEAVAIRCGESAIGYGELNQQANRLAHYLRRQGAAPGMRIAICIERRPELIVAMLAIAKSGAAYVPLDPAYDNDRLSHMLQDSEPLVVLIHSHASGALRQRIEAATAASVIAIDDDCAAWQQESALNPAPSEAQWPVYVIYTSGSTGQPKGVITAHRNLHNLVSWHIDAFGLRPGHRAPAMAGVGFDATGWEIWPSLCSGGSLLLPDAQSAQDPQALLLWLNRQAAESAFLITPLLEMACVSGLLNPGITTLLTGGDRLTRRPDALPPAQKLFNNYGPTECTVVATSGEIPPGEAMPHIGRPIANTQIYILDEHFRLTPAGVAGEICIGGAGVTCGYLNRPELTAERFIADPFVDGGRLYRSGDLGRWRPDGALEYLGRNDAQVKLRGFRIEPGEIEAQLAQVAGVREVALLLREDRPGERHLAAYYTGEALEPAQLRREAEARLPEYMVPAAYVHLTALPLTANGKLDRRALPVPEGDAYARQAWAEPQGETEQTLAQLWQALLPGVERVGRHDNFFELGGHSLLAVRLVSRLRQTLAAELALSEVFNHPTLCDLAARIAQSQPATLSAIARQPRGESLPLSLAQQRLWFLAQMDGVSESYHISDAVRLTGELNVPALEQALGALLQRHEALRTLFRLENGAPRQVIMADPEQILTLRDMRHHPAETLQAQCSMFASRRFELSEELPLRLQLLQTGEQAWLLQVVMHHIAADGWSVGIFLRELSALYNAALAGDSAGLEALPIQYADYAVWQRDWLAEGRLDAQLAYWRETLADAPVLLELPLDHARPAQQSTAGDSVALHLGAELSAQLRALSQRHGVTLYMTLLAGWAVLLSRLSGQEEVVIGTPVAGREREEVEGLIGFFVNTLALRLAPGRSANVDELLTAVRERVLAAQAHQALPFDQVVEAVQPPRSLAHTPL